MRTEDTVTLPPSSLDTAQTSKSATAPPKPSCHLQPPPPVNDPALSPDPSPLPQRKVVQSGAAPSDDVLIPIEHSGSREGEGGGTEGGISSWTPLSPSSHCTQHFDSDVFSGSAAHENVSDFKEPHRNPQRSSIMSTSSVASRTSNVAGSVESHDSVFGSCKSDTSVTLAKTGSRGGSLNKPVPPPKPKSLERGNTSSSGTSSQSDRQKMRTKGEQTATGGGGGVKARDAPPPKPPRPMRGSVKLDRIVGVEDEERGRGGGRGNAEAVPPPKPARRNRSVKMPAKVTGAEQRTPERKVQTMQPQAASRNSWSADRSSQGSVDDSPSVAGTSAAAPRKPAAKPRTTSSRPRAQAKQIPQSSSSLLKERIAAKLSKEGISLSDLPYSTVVRMHACVWEYTFCVYVYKHVVHTLSIIYVCSVQYIMYIMHNITYVHLEFDLGTCKC